MSADCPVCLNRLARIEQLEDRNTALHNEVRELRLTIDVAVRSARDAASCRDRALEQVTAARSVASADFAYYATSCAAALPEKQKKQLLTRGLAAIDELLADQEASLSYDDRSDILALCRSLASDLEQPEAARKYALTQRELLAKAVADAGTAAEEMIYVWHQVEVHAFLEEGEKILPWVESLQKRLPKEYDPPYRKAWLLFDLARHEEARTAAQAALALAQGVRRGRILGLLADIYKAEGNLDKERETRTAVVAHYESLAPGHRSQGSIDRAKKALEEMGAAAKE